MKRPVAAVVAFALAACSEEPPQVQPYSRPSPRAGNVEATCASLAKEEGATWSDRTAVIHVGEGPIAIGDPSVLGGPFAPPVRVQTAPGDPPIRVLLGKTRAGDARPICVQIALGDARPVSFRPLGDVAIDTDLLAVVDEHAYLAHVRAFGAPLVAGVEIDADHVPAMTKALADRGLPVEHVFATFLRGTRPLDPADGGRIRDALKALSFDGKIVVEPDSPAHAFVRALGDEPFTSFELDGMRAFVAESTNGDGAYSVALGVDDAGKPASIEIKLAP